MQEETLKQRWWQRSVQLISIMRKRWALWGLWFLTNSCLLTFCVFLQTMHLNTPVTDDYFTWFLIADWGFNFYRAMHYVHSAVLRSYVVCPSVRMWRSGTEITIGWNSSKITSRPNSLRPWLLGHPTWAMWCDGNIPKIGVELGWGHSAGQKTCNISEMGRDTTKVTITD